MKWFAVAVAYICDCCKKEHAHVRHELVRALSEEDAIRNVSMGLAVEDGDFHITETSALPLGDRGGRADGA